MPMEEDVQAADAAAGTRSHRLRSTHQADGMESSVLRFKNVNFVVPQKKNDDKFILRNVSGTVKFGHVLAVLGPSGAGKTTLINALTLDAFYGKPYGSVTLNGTTLTDRIFKNHCYVVVQHDKHWPYLTCKETLLYAAELYSVATQKSELVKVVDDIIDKMGLRICADTRNARLSGGQARRLSIGMALLKRPTLLFLDEPTSGLDAAAAEQIMKEIVRVAKDEGLIILCTIHQPSTKVFEGFDQVMIMSKGREAFTGDVAEAAPYFESIGHPLPGMTNPAEHFLDLVNADFSSGTEVEHILNTWEEKKSGGVSSHHKRKGFGVEEGRSGVTDIKRAPLSKEVPIMFRRHMTLIVRDPILYIGRAVVFLIANAVFALVYFTARKYNQEQALNKMWINVWHVGVASNMGVVAVYSLNDEFKTVVREAKNGMVGPLTYVLAKTVMVIPIMFIFAIFALGVPSIAIMDFPGDSFGTAVLLWAALMYVFECVAECLSVWIDDPIAGMLNYMNFWFASFLFGGFLIPLRDMFWPFEVFYYIMPFAYYLRSQMYNYLIDSTWTPCDPNNNVQRSSVCVTPPTGENVLQRIGLTYPVVEANDTYTQDLFALITIAIFYKIVYIAGVYVKGSKAAKIHPNNEYHSSSGPSIQAPLPNPKNNNAPAKAVKEKPEPVNSIVQALSQPVAPVGEVRVAL